jgi:hypothetical protein
MGCENFHPAAINAGCDGGCRFGPTPNRICDIPVRRVAVSNMHARLIVNGPQDISMLRG